MRLAVLRVNLLGFEASGKIAIDPSSNLYELHLVLQKLMGWRDVHMHEFVAGDRVIRSVTGIFRDFDELSELDTKVSDVLRKPGDTILYVYDYSAEWVHSVELLGFLETESCGPIFIEKEGEFPGEV